MSTKSLVPLVLASLGASFVTGELTGCGSAGNAGGTGGAGASGGSSGTGGSNNDTCLVSTLMGQGEVDVVFAGLPVGTTGTVEVEGGGDAPQSRAAPASFFLPPGQKVVRAPRITIDDPTARTVYEPTQGELKGRSICVIAGEIQTVTVRYTLVGPSNKLWASNIPDGRSILSLVGFASLTVASGGTATALVSAETKSRSFGMPPMKGSPVSVFDVSGNVWTTNADGWLVRYPAAAVAAGGDVSFPERRIEREVNPAGLAMDPSGGLWVSMPSSRTITGYAPEQLEAAGQMPGTLPVPDAELSGVGDASGMAFDRWGNLWIGSGGPTIFRFGTSRLKGLISQPDLTVRVNGLPSGPYPALGLAFDASGTLWINDGQSVWALKEWQLSALGDVALAPIVKLDFEVPLGGEGIAFDETGGLWIPYGNGRLARLSSAQLASAGTKVPDRVIDSVNLGDVRWLAIYPAPAALPLYHRLP